MDLNDHLKVIGATLRDYRSAGGISQESFADAIGMHRAYYGSIERGTRNLTVSTLIRVCKGLSLSPSEVLRKSGL
jgi:transcriptional regulator with XRE-family HTH domain